MLFSALRGDRSAIISLLLTIPLVLLSLSFHEAAHAFMAYKMGDPTARNLGRMTLNPIRHIHPLGFLSMMLVGIGWAKPVPINARNFENPRKGMMLSSLAGPVSNLALGIVFCLLECFAWANFRFQVLSAGHQEDIVYWLSYVFYLLTYLGAYLNFALAIFNLIPAPPFDGSRIFFYFLPKDWYFKVMKYEQYIGIGILVVFLALSWLGWNPVSFLAGGLHDLVYKPFDLLSNLIYANPA
ncbi:MAG: site-2 protease family protein [Clostridia bacterium]|nr:site-2 protease family protein [Clostridia bacterium]